MILARLLIVALSCTAFLTTTAFTTSTAYLTTGLRTTSLKMASLYDFKLKDMAGVEQSLSKYRGKVVLLENVASL